MYVHQRIAAVDLHSDLDGMPFRARIEQDERAQESLSATKSCDVRIVM
jgi:hypothetical protein